MPTPLRTHLISTCIVVLLVFSFSAARAQNLVPNPSFEDYIVCPYVWGQITSASPWWRATNGSPDYFHRCGTNGWGVPYNNGGFQEPRTGDAYAGEVFIYSGPPNYREYIFVPLAEELQAGIPYDVGFWVVLRDENAPCPNSEFGAHFSVDEPPYSGSYDGPLDFIPQFKPEPGFISDTQNWTLLTDCIVFEGGERYMTIGNFTPLGEVPMHPDCSSGLSGISYYLIEDVFVIPRTTEELEVELGDSIIVCDDYTISPGIPDVLYHWSTGSTDPSITVSSTGYYTVTITQGCQFGRDSVYVFFPENTPVDLGSPSAELCVNEEMIIELDPMFDYVWQDGSTSSTYTISTAGLYQVTMHDGCHTSSDAILIQALEPPEPFSIDGNPYLCQDEDLIIALDPELGDFEWSDGSSHHYLVVTTPGEYELTISNMCGFATGSVDVIPMSPPSVALGPDTFFCGVQELLINIEIDTQYNAIVWSDNSVEPQFVISQGGVYAVTITNPCGMDRDTITVSAFTSPDISLEHDMLLCSLGSGLILSPGNVPGGLYTWQDGSHADTFLVSTPGHYSVTVTNACGLDSASINIDTMVAIRPFDLGDDVVLCAGDSIVLSLSIPGATYLWQDGSVVDSQVIKNSGLYYVTASNACGAQSDTIDVSYTAAAPVLNLSDPITLCQGQSVQLESGISGVGYTWSDNSTDPTLLVSGPGIYSLTVSNNCGSDADTVIIIDGGPLPAVDLGIDLSLCEGDTLDLLPTFSDVDTWLWSNGDNNSSIAIATGGELSVIVTNSCGTAYDTINSTLLPAIPAFSLGNDTAICAGEIVTLSINVPDVSIAWSDGSGGNNIITNVAGQYFATISNTCGQYADTINISQLPAIPPLDLGDDQSLCPGELFVIDPGIPDVNYLWQDGSTGSTFSTTQPITISLTISNACGSASDELIIVESTEGPEVYLGNDIVGCAGEEVTIQSGISGVDYMWQDGSTQSSFTTNVSGAFILNVSNNCGVDADTILVDLSGVAPMVGLGADTLLCDDDNLVLTVTTPNLTAITWQDGSSTSSFEVNVAGSYFVIATNNCGEASDTIAVAYEFSPQPFSLGPDTVLCAGETIVLTAPATTNAIQWQDGSSAPTYLADQSQVYSLQISNQCGAVSDELQLTILDESFSIDLDPVIHWCPQQVIEVDAEQTFDASYQWNTGATSSSITITSPGVYALTIQTQCGMAEDSFEVTQNDDCFPKVIYYIPNIFSPNGDGINDVFTVQFNADAEVLSILGTIHDRWGDVLFSSNDNPFLWNGTRNGQLMNPAVFVYVFQFTFLRNGETVTEKVTGDITLMK